LIRALWGIANELTFSNNGAKFQLPSPDKAAYLTIVKNVNLGAETLQPCSSTPQIALPKMAAMKAFLISLFPILSLAAAPNHREQTAELLAKDALLKQDPEASLASCNFTKLISDGLFTCYSVNLGPKAVCDDNSRSAPFWIVEGYLDAELQPQVGQVLYYEACTGVQR
jgi:hypothetical protein